MTTPETALRWYEIPRTMIDGSKCPNCGGHVSTANGTDYECDDCGAEFDGADLFLP